MFVRPAIPARAVARLGNPPTEKQHNDLVLLAQQTTIQRGPLKGRQSSDGFTPRYVASTSVDVDSAFRVSISDGDQPDELIATFTTGDVAGIIPSIDSVALDDTDADGNPPQLTIPQDAWAPSGNVQRALIMFRYDLQHETFAVIAVTPVAVATPPAAAPWTWHKLIAVLTKSADGSVNIAQRVFFSQNFAVANAQLSGGFVPLPFPAS